MPVNRLHEAVRVSESERISLKRRAINDELVEGKERVARVAAAWAIVVPAIDRADQDS